MIPTPAETAQATTAILESGAIMLGAALVFVTLFRQLKLGATLGYIVGGALIGPQVLGLIRDPEQTLSITEIGIALLLFIVGLELQPKHLAANRQRTILFQPSTAFAPIPNRAQSGASTGRL